MKRSQQGVPSRETGRTAGDFSRTQSIKMPEKGGHNKTMNEGRRGSGIAPKPSGGAALPGSDRPSMPSNGGLARVRGTGNSGSGPGSSAGSFLPVQKPQAGIANQRVGQKETAPPGSSSRISPQTRTSVVGNPVATNKPKRKGLGAAFYGEY